MKKNLHKQLITHIPRLRRYARALFSTDRHQAEDLVQECLARALGRLNLWQEGTDMRAWLFTIMHNLYVNQIKRMQAAPTMQVITEEDLMTKDPVVMTRDINQALAGLPADQREILLMVTLEGLRYHEIATILSIPEGTVMSRLARARERLRNILELDQSRLRRVK